MSINPSISTTGYCMYPGIPPTQQKQTYTTQEVKNVVSAADSNKDGYLTPGELNNYGQAQQSMYIASGHNKNLEIAKVLANNFGAIQQPKINGQTIYQSPTANQRTIEAADIDAIAKLDGNSSSFTVNDVKKLDFNFSSFWPTTSSSPGYPNPGYPPMPPSYPTTPSVPGSSYDQLLTQIINLLIQLTGQPATM